MIHVVAFEKTAFSTPFRGVLPPFGQQISAESERATQSLPPEKPGWPPTSLRRDAWREDGWTSRSRATWVILNACGVRDRANNGRTGP